MANLIKVTVAKVTEASNGNFIHTLKTEGKKVKLLGQDMVTNGVTYYAALKSGAEVNSTGEFDLESFDVVKRPFTFTNDDGEEVNTELSWLYPKK
jgi:hypothetical protein